MAAYKKEALQLNLEVEAGFATIVNRRQYVELVQ